MSTCDCFATHCEIQTQYCPVCRSKTQHHVSDSPIHPVTHHECLNCDDIREIPYMTDAEIWAETRKAGGGQ
jgi:hypothetical protein